MFKHIVERGRYTSTLEIDDSLPYLSLTCVDSEGEEIGNFTLQEWEVENCLGYEPTIYSNLDRVIETMEGHIFG